MSHLGNESLFLEVKSTMDIWFPDFLLELGEVRNALTQLIATNAAQIKILI